MTFYVKSLFFAIPIFTILIIIEAIIAHYRNIPINRSEDVISSLSSGLTNIIRDGIKFSIIIISYAWLVDKIALYKLESLWLAIAVAFIIEDFAGYWMHRLNHRVNIFWNRHIIHHSSEEFNLACALRQSISTTFTFSAIFMLPAALLGIPPIVFAILTPIHLYMQFWYHTQLINKMGVLEYILVTPSHHRVHHAINPEYIDRNYSQIFIFWDKLFGTFQPELENVKPVYGTLKPAGTWNPILINYKHMWQIIKDAWRTKRFIDKVRVWFMPTGWRPDDVKKKYPVKIIDNPENQVKYTKDSSKLLISWSWIQLIITDLFLFHMLVMVPSQNALMSYLYAGFLLVHIFSYTSALDHSSYTILSELGKFSFGFYLIFSYGFSWFGMTGFILNAVMAYFVFSLIMTYYFYKSELVPSI
mgnify:CR=1 FL=1